MNEKSLTLLSAAAVALAYFTGFCYLYFYYRFYGIDINELDFNIQHVFVHAYPAYWVFIKTYIGKILVSLVILSLASYGIYHYFRPGLYVVASAVIIFLTVLSYNVSAFSGERNARENFKRLSVLSVALRKEHMDSFDVAQLQGARHIVTTGTKTYALRFSGNGDEFWTIRIPNDILARTTSYMDQ